MILWFVQQLLLFRKFVQAKDTPRQLAWGLALGMLIGLVPKGNLLAVVLSMVLLGTRANLAVGMISGLAFSLIGMFLDPLTDPLGLAVLNHASLRPTWLRLYQLPLAPWTSMNNSVVMGSLILGLTLLYPSYRLSFPLFQKYLAWRDRKSPNAAAESGATAEAGTTAESGAAAESGATAEVGATAEAGATTEAGAEAESGAAAMADVPTEAVARATVEAAVDAPGEVAADSSSQALTDVTAEALLEPSAEGEDGPKSVEPGAAPCLDRPRPRRRLVGLQANRVNA